MKHFLLIKFSEQMVRVSWIEDCYILSILDINDKRARRRAMAMTKGVARIYV